MSTDDDDLLYRLIVNVEAPNWPGHFTADDFQTVIHTAIKNVLGLTGLLRLAGVTDFDRTKKQGSVIVGQKYAQRFALNLGGRLRLRQSLWQSDCVARLQGFPNQAKAMLTIIATVLLLFLLILLLICFVLSDRAECRPIVDFRGYHVMVTGGSKGIGRALAVEAVLRGADVTIVAKNVENLRRAVDHLRSIRPGGPRQRVNWYSHDLMNDWKGIGDLVRKIESEVGCVDVLINNVGGAVQSPLMDTEDQAFLDQMKLNYVTAACTTKHVVKCMKRHERKEYGRRIVFVSSQAGQVGLYGYCAYSASKFALRGFAEAVQMETRSDLDLWTTVAYPPHTDTEGFAEEWKQTPELTKAITSAGEPMKADQVAKRIMDSMARGHFDCHFGVEGWMLSTLCSGMSPVNGWVSAFVQTLFMGVLRCVGLSYLKKFNFTVSNWYRPCASFKGTKL